MVKKSFVLIVVLLFCGCAAGEEKSMSEKLIHGRTVQLGFGFPYYANRSAESIASEVAVNGFDGVYIMPPEEKYLSKELFDEFHKRGIAVAAMFMPTMPPSKDVLPKGWEAWLMECTDPEYPFQHLSFINRGYVEWFKTYVTKALGGYDFDGFVMAEPFYSAYAWNEPNKTKVTYCDVSPAFQAAFKKATGNTAFPNLTDAGDPHYYRTDTKLYNDLVDYRAKTVVDVYDEIVNGPDGVRAKFPGMVVGGWSLAVDIEDAVRKLREWEGHDAEQMVRRVRPDIQFLQTHWPDWFRPEGELPPDYAKCYAPFIAAIKRADPNMPVGLQADIGSREVMRKSAKWYKDFVKGCADNGIDSTTYYMLSTRGEVYRDAPVLKKVTRAGFGAVKLHFDQVIDPNCAGVLVGRVLEGDGNNYTVASARADGSILILTVGRPVAAGETLKIPVGGVCDLPSVRFSETGNFGPVNSIAEGTIVEMKVDAGW